MTNAVRALLDVESDLQHVAEFAARRLPEICGFCEVPIADADSATYRMAIFAAVLDDKANIDHVLDEVERLMREIVSNQQGKETSCLRNPQSSPN